jgi:hypothetical protein
MARVTGIGGVFFKRRNDNTALARWYEKHLGMRLDDKAEDQGVTVWHVAEKESEWFSPSNSAFMTNYRVDRMDHGPREEQEHLKRGCAGAPGCARPARRRRDQQ